MEIKEKRIKCPLAWSLFDFPSNVWQSALTQFLLYQCRITLCSRKVYHCVFVCACAIMQRDTVQCPLPSQNTEGGTHAGSSRTALRRTWFYTLAQPTGRFPPCALFLSRMQLLLFSTRLLGFRPRSLRYKPCHVSSTWLIYPHSLLQAWHKPLFSF